MPTNQLCNASSPYLLQHQTNPVHWWEWSEEAFDYAIKQDKPIFLSIGYATCHWCHVMAHESFEDQQVAKLLNQWYVCIKLDREERPDLDHLYMTACQLTNGHGGWPLSVFLNHQKEPFYTATYIPKESRNEQLGMLDLLPRIASIWEQDRQKVTEYGLQLRRLLHEDPAAEDSNKPPLGIPENLFHTAFENLQKEFDSSFGGFGRAPKFPSLHQLEFLYSYATAFEQPKALEMVQKTLIGIRQGGIYDQIGYGIHRYSTDRQWLLPHFEKMLYDQAGLLRALAASAELTASSTLLQKTAEETLNYLCEQMQHPSGAFYAAEDADSEGEEGRFYVWEAQEIEQILGKDAQKFSNIFNVKAEGNFKEEATGRPIAQNILHLKKEYSDWASELNETENSLKTFINSCIDRLKKHRNSRIRPQKDEKILTDWNSWLITAFCGMYRSSGNHIWLDKAKKTHGFLVEHLLNDDRLKHRYIQHKSELNAMAPDWLAFCLAELYLYESTLEPAYLKQAIKHIEVAIELLWDEQHGGFFFAEDSKDLIIRQKDFYDGAYPSANSLGHLLLQRLYAITGQLYWRDLVDKLEDAAYPHLQHFPQGHLFLLLSCIERRKQAEVIIHWDADLDQLQKVAIEIHSKAKKPIRVIGINALNCIDIAKIIPFTAPLGIPTDRMRLYLCQNQQCERGVTSISALLKQLQ